MADADHNSARKHSPQYPREPHGGLEAEARLYDVTGLDVLAQLVGHQRVEALEEGGGRDGGARHVVVEEDDREAVLAGEQLGGAEEVPTEEEEVDEEEDEEEEKEEEEDEEEISGLITQLIFARFDV